MAENYQDITQKLEVIQSRLQRHLPDQVRLFDSQNLLKRRASLLIGPRGTGKTTFLVEMTKNKLKRSLYFSLDNPIFAAINLYDYGDWLFQNGYDNILLDEVHCHDNWSSHLKGLYDAYPDKKIIASDSSSLVIRKGLGDLSRRFVVERFPFLSFREFLYLKYQLSLPDLSWEDFLHLGKTESWFVELRKIVGKKNLNLSREFKEYLKGGVRPFFFEENYADRLTQTIEKIIHQDIPYFLPEVKERHLHLMNHVISYLLQSQIPTLNIESLATRWSVSKPTVYNLLTVMESSYVISIIKKKGSISEKTKGQKIFLSDVSTYSALQGLVGNQREAFFCMQMGILGKKIYAVANEEVADFEVDERTFEIGGAHKKRKKSDLVLRDNYDEFSNGVRPLWSLGFLG